MSEKKKMWQIVSKSALNNNNNKKQDSYVGQPSIM